MGPKKGKAVIIDGVDTSTMTRQELEIFGLRLKEENEREREERNYFQMERDKLRTFWEITRTELQEARAKVRNKDRQIEEGVEKNDEELRFYKQKVKHLQHEHENDLTEAKADAIVSLKMAQDDHVAQEREFLADKIALKSKTQEQELSHQDQVKSLKVQHSEEICKVRVEYEIKAKELEIKYERKFQELKEELSIKHNMEMSEVEERKNGQINALISHHEAAFNEMKMYYNDITLNNLALISSLKDQMEVLRKQNERMTKQVADLVADNKRMAEPLRQAKADVAEFKRQLQNYAKDKTSLQNTKTELERTKQHLDDLKWTNEALELRFEKLQYEKDTLQGRFSKAVLEVQQKSAAKNLMLQKRVQTLADTIDQKEILLEAIESQSDRSRQINKLSNKLEEILKKKDSTINELKYELARVCKAHDDLLRSFQDKLREYGIPLSELGFTPLRVIPEGQVGLSRGPAGLVTQNR